MANDFVCARCGWPESDHVINKKQEWSEKGRERRSVVKQGFQTTLLGKDGCQGRYVLSDNERNAKKALKKLVKAPPPRQKSFW